MNNFTPHDIFLFFLHLKSEIMEMCAVFMGRDELLMDTASVSHGLRFYLVA